MAPGAAALRATRPFGRPACNASGSRFFFPDAPKKNKRTMAVRFNDDSIREEINAHRDEIDRNELLIGDWDVSEVTDMSYLFFSMQNFNQELRWDTRNVTRMDDTFNGCISFNQPLAWETGNVRTMKGTFQGCRNFDQPLAWDTGNVTEMWGIFMRCEAFNQPLEWDTTNVRDLAFAFEGCINFNQPLAWVTINVRDLEGTFRGCKSFNQPLTLNEPFVWDVRNVENMASTFEECAIFDQPFDSIRWSTTKVTSMMAMFRNAARFNQPLEFDTRNVRNMNYTFAGCTSFNQPLAWDTQNVETMVRTFAGCSNFNQVLNWNMRSVTNDEHMYLGTLVEQNDEGEGARVPEDLAALHRYERAPRAPHAPQARGLNSDDGDRAPEEGSDQEECAVCITNAGRYKLECGHTFCGTCLEKIYASEQLAQKCPLCRGPLTRVRFEDRLFFGSRHWPLPALLRVLDEAVGRGGLAGLSGLSNPRAIPPERAVSGAQRAKCDLYARKAVCHLQRAEHSTARAAHIARALQYARKAVCVRCGKHAARRYELA